jgi:hypothetical protein
MAASLDPRNSAEFLQDLGFLLTPDVPAEGIPAYLLVALRRHPTLSHFDPEQVEYWATSNGRGLVETLTAATHVPLETPFAWGLIRVVDRLDVSNEYLTFGGSLTAAAVDGFTVAVFASPAPILRRGGHSQTWDPGSQHLAGFFARLRAAAGCGKPLEAHIGTASPLTRYAAYIMDSLTRYRTSDLLRTMHPASWAALERQERILRSTYAAEWAAGQVLLLATGMAGSQEPVTVRGGESSEAR